MKNDFYKKTIINSAFLTKKVDFKDIVKLKLNSNEFAELLEQFLNNDVEIMIDNELMVIEDESFYSDDSLKMFINEINTFKRLTKEEEQVLLKLYKKGFGCNNPSCIYLLLFIKLVSFITSLGLTNLITMSSKRTSLPIFEI